MKKIAFLLLFFYCVNNLFSQKTGKGNVHILYTPNHPLNSFVPSQNIGGAIDGHFKGDISTMLTPENIKMMETVGLKPISYRLRTELAGEVWHWNPVGKWSDSTNQQGYWVSDSVSKKPIEISYGYRLPRRGNTHDQANDDGYSRICDGDTSTFWKSNPYLDTYYTHDSNELHPQWVIIDLGRYRKMNAIRIKWGNPYALSYKIDYARGYDLGYFDPYEPGIWYPFPQKIIENENGENKIIRIAAIPVRVRFIRISMTQSSYTAQGGAKDIRDSLGFSINEMQAGWTDSNGKFHDWIRHSPDHDQTVIRVSSTDPWHTASDLDPNTEQAGIDFIFTSGITAGQPALFPAALLYDTPDNVLAMIKYFKAKHYLVNELEMGEEPEGQLISPVDYGALYFQLGKKIREIEPAMRMGGPGFASLSFTPDDSTTFTESKWTSEFLNYLKIHNSLDLFNFFSFEWYPFDNICTSPAPQLLTAPDMLSIALENIRNNSLPKNTPLYITEYGYSAYEGISEVEIEGALMYADILGKYMQLGGSKSFLYGYEPAWLQESYKCGGYGNNMLLGLGDNGKVKYKTAAFYAMQMLTHFWAQPADSSLDIYPSECDVYNRKKKSLIASYPVRTPDGKWSVMLINKDPGLTSSISVDIKNTVSNKIIEWQPSHLIQYSKIQYHWKSDGMNSHPDLDNSPITKKIKGSKDITLPPYSITIIY
jgi:hypothetical protein